MQCSGQEQWLFLGGHFVNQTYFLVLLVNFVQINSLYEHILYQVKMVYFFVNVKYYKTIQFKQCRYSAKLFPIDHVLCPVAKIRTALELCTSRLPFQAPAFVKNGSGLPMHSGLFNYVFKILVARIPKII